MTPVLPEEPDGRPGSSKNVARRGLPRLSIVIANYNYERYLRDAIESALAVDYADKEVIVVDDGSTDGSREVIATYGDAIRTLHQRNGGQRSAYDAGFGVATGEVVIFLDSDDLLSPDVAAKILPLFGPSVSKVQYQLAVIDALGHATGALFPQFLVSCEPDAIRRWYLTAFNYPTPPGSGNAYSADFLRKIMPIGADLIDRAGDSYLIGAAPFYGDVVTVAEPLAMYRVHGDNFGALSSFDIGRIQSEYARSVRRFSYCETVARQGGVSFRPGAFDMSLYVLPYRLASRKLGRREHVTPTDSVGSVLLLFARAIFVEQGQTVTASVALLVWAVAVALSPVAVARRIALWRFASGSRPRWISRILVLARAVRSGSSATASS